jgi:hypothetical protein
MHRLTLTKTHLHMMGMVKLNVKALKGGNAKAVAAS